ncbi:MAG TPA: AMP-binding protein, partial [Candidatus Gastranaerophilaceae bacterium]|nr:AMP-binding protein [Candidatus Gastranaerophilaceae bacterium]
MKYKKSNILLLLEEKTDVYNDRVALGIKTALGWKEFTFKGIGLLSRKLASYLINDIQVKKGEKLAILSESKPEYGACVFASVMSGMVTVPLDVKLTKYELKSILLDCQPTILLTSQENIDKALDLQKEIKSIKHVILIDEPSYNLQMPCLYTLPNNYDCKWRHRSSKSTAFIIYTSGTTGAPKGVEITFRNMLAQLNDMSKVYYHFFDKNEGISVLSILPMNHLFELTVGFSTFLYWGLSVYYTQSLKPKDILSIMREKGINFMIVVPAFLKLLKAGIETEIANSPKSVQVGFKVMYNIAKRIPSYAVRKMMFKKIHDKFGGNFNGCIAGGAPLDLAVAEFFETIGIKVYQGYGLSETSPVVSVNYDKRWMLASVGRPLESFEAKIDPKTGEILLRGPSVMKGYHNQPELTAEVIDADGWLHTGDIGRIDEDSHIFITGRLKNMIVLSGGKKVFPEEVESVLEKSQYFAEVCVLGSARSGGSKDGTEDIVAVVVPKEDLINKVKDEKEINRIVREEVKYL